VFPDDGCRPFFPFVASQGHRRPTARPPPPPPRRRSRCVARHWAGTPTDDAAGRQNEEACGLWRTTPLQFKARSVLVKIWYRRGHQHRSILLLRRGKGPKGPFGGLHLILPLLLSLLLRQLPLLLIPLQGSKQRNNSNLVPWNPLLIQCLSHQLQWPSYIYRDGGSGDFPPSP
jgi:hypothetical protein